MKKQLMAIFFGSALVLSACGGEEEAEFTDADELNEDAVEENPLDEDTEETGEDVEVTEETPEEGTETETPEEGSGEELATADVEQIIQQNCSSCHGADLAGAGNFPALNDVGSRLSSDEILAVIHEGPGPMPADIITGAEAEAVAEYLSTLK